MAVNVWKLRRAFLHSGKTGGIPIDEFEPVFFMPRDDLYCGSFHIITTMNADEPERKIRIAVEGLCFKLRAAVKAFWDKNHAKYDFSTAHISIRNSDAEIAKLNG